MKTEERKTYYVAVFQAEDMNRNKINVALTIDDSDRYTRYSFVPWPDDEDDPRGLYHCIDPNLEYVSRFISDPLYQSFIPLPAQWISHVNFSTGRIVAINTITTFETKVEK